MLLRRFLLTLGFFCLALSVPAKANVILSEDFESGVLNPAISIQTVGTFGTPPGIKNLTNFGSTKAFGVNAK